MRRIDPIRFFGSVFFAALGATAAIIAAVHWSGATFGQRCERYYPSATSLQLARCVEQLAAGKSVTELPDTAIAGEQP